MEVPSSERVWGACAKKSEVVSQAGGVRLTSVSTASSYPNVQGTMNHRSCEAPDTTTIPSVAKVLESTVYLRLYIRDERLNSDVLQGPQQVNQACHSMSPGA